MLHRLRALLALAFTTAALALGAVSAAAITIGPGGAGTQTGSITFAGPRIAFRCGATLNTTTTAGALPYSIPIGVLATIGIE